jgi:glutathione S-transferase
MTMALDFYWFSGSCNSWRVMLALELKRVPYQAHLLTHAKGEHKSPEYLAINPRGQVPAIKDGDFTLYQSMAILLYLDRKYPDPPLFGRTAEQGGRILQRAQELVFHLEPKVDRVVLPIYQGKVAEQAAAIQAAAVEAHAELARWEAVLADGPFLAGDAVSAADLTAVAFVQHLRRGAGKEAARPLELGLLPLEARYPRLAAWLGRMEALPGYERTYPPHWR